MKKLTAIPTFDKNGILNGIEVVDCIYLPDEVTIDGEQLNLRASTLIQRLIKHFPLQYFTGADALQILENSSWRNKK